MTAAAFFELLFHSLLHAGKDLLTVIPFLYLAYLLLEYFEHKSGDAVSALLHKSGKVAPLCGGLLGVLPQCGFSSAAAGLYAGRLISLGTLAAVFLSTSDEMLPLLLSEGLPVLPVLALCGVKAAVGIAFGFLIDFLFRKKEEGEGHEHVNAICKQEKCHCEGHNIFVAALIHTAKITLFLFLISFALEVAIDLLGEETLSSFVVRWPFFSLLLAGLVGIIPNCAASVLLTELYLSGALTIGGLLCGLLIGAGVGILVLFRTNRNLKENLLFLLGLYGISVLCGFLADCVALDALLGLAA